MVKIKNSTKRVFKTCFRGVYNRKEQDTQDTLAHQAKQDNCNRLLGVNIP